MRPSVTFENFSVSYKLSNFTAELKINSNDPCWECCNPPHPIQPLSHSCMYPTPMAPMSVRSSLHSPMSMSTTIHSPMALTQEHDQSFSPASGKNWGWRILGNSHSWGTILNRVEKKWKQTNKHDFFGIKNDVRIKFSTNIKFVLQKCPLLPYFIAKL